MVVRSCPPRLGPAATQSAFPHAEPRWTRHQAKPRAPRGDFALAGQPGRALSGAVARTLPAMTAVQAVVAMGTFALSVLAPQLGVDVRMLGLIGSALFAIGALSSLMAGWLIRR